MAVEKIQATDSLNTGRVKLNAAIDQSNEAITKATSAVATANQAKSTADNVQAQFNQVVIEGDSSVEAAQARVDADGNVYTTLKERLDSKETEFSTQLAQINEKVNFEINKPLLKNGKINLPSDFPNLPFEIKKTRKRYYTHNATPYNQHDWSNATEIFIAHEGVTATDGTDYNKPITLAKFVSNVGSGVYGTQKNFILTFLSNVYISNVNADFINLGINVFFRSGSLSGFTWIGRVKRNGVETTGWASDSGVYKTTIDVSTHGIIYAVNVNDTDSFDMPRPYQKVTTLSECQATEGTFYQNSGDVWVHPYEGENVENISLLVSTRILNVSESAKNTIMFQNVGFMAESYSFIGGSVNTKFMFFNCKFHRGFNDAFAITGAYQAYLFDCISAWASKDGFNYHTTSTDSLAVEVNCISYGNGKYKLAGGNTTRHSNNGSTAHDGMYMLRVGGKYWDCEGPVVADADDCYSISIGCEVGNILSTSTGKKAGFLLYDGDSTVHRKKYIIECLANGKNIDFGISGTAETYYMDFEGMNTHEGEIKAMDWEDII